MQNQQNINNLPHSIMLVSQDEMALLDHSFWLAKKIFCENKSACGFCEQCKKIEHQNHADFFVFPKEKEVISVDEILQIVEESFVLPFETDKKVFVLKKFSETSSLVQNKLLKTLEEPPKNVYFILLVSNENRVLPTIKSRCQKLFLPKFNDDEIFDCLSDFDFEQEKRQNIVDFCDGMKAKALEFALSKDFDQTLELVFDVWKNLRMSSQVLFYASKLYDTKTSQGKQVFQNFLFLYEIFLREIIHTKLGAFQFLKNQKRKDLFEEIAKDFSLKSLLMIEKICLKTKQSIETNCNQNIVVDQFFLKILEERAKWH